MEKKQYSAVQWIETVQWRQFKAVSLASPVLDSIRIFPCWHLLNFSSHKIYSKSSHGTVTYKIQFIIWMKRSAIS